MGATFPAIVFVEMEHIVIFCFFMCFAALAFHFTLADDIYTSDVVIDYFRYKLILMI